MEDLKNKIVNCSHYQECNYISKEYDKKCSDSTSILQCIKYKDYNEKRNRCPYFDKCNDTNLKNCSTSICNHIDYIYFTTCEHYTKFEKEKNRCPYYDQCVYHCKDSEVCGNIENKLKKYRLCPILRIQGI